MDAAPDGPPTGPTTGPPTGLPPGAADPVVLALREAGCVFAEDEARLLRGTARSPAELEDMVARRVAGAPLEPLLGWTDFAGLRLPARPGVFVPRRRTELLARRAADAARAAVAAGRDPVVAVDLCCGGGAVAAVVAAALSDALGDVAAGTGPRRGYELHAADVDPVAVAAAAQALEATGARCHVGDLFDALPRDLRGRIDVLTANAPYVPTDAIASLPPEARDHEPRTALDGGRDGLGVLTRVLGAAPAWLAPGATVLVECSRGQAPRVRDIAGAAGLRAQVVVDDEHDATAVVATARA